MCKLWVQRGRLPGTARSVSLSVLGSWGVWEASAWLCAVHPGLGREGRGEQVCGELQGGAAGRSPEELQGWREPSLSQCWGLGTRHGPGLGAATPVQGSFPHSAQDLLPPVQSCPQAYWRM